MEIDKKFWNEFNMPTEHDDFLITIATRIVLGENLTNIDTRKFFMLILSMALTDGISEKDFNIKIKKFKQSIPNFLKTVDGVLDEVQEAGAKIFKLQNTVIERANNLPPLAHSLDSDDVIEFIRSLTKERYSFAEAAKLLGKTRQTLRIYANEGLHNLKVVQEKKSEYLTKESVVDFYRNQYLEEHGHDLF